jgi:hypothetical protein
MEMWGAVSLARSMKVALRQPIITAARDGGEIGLAQDFQNVAFELGPFIQEAHAVARQRDFPRHQHLPSTEPCASNAAPQHTEASPARRGSHDRPGGTPLTAWASASEAIARVYDLLYLMSRWL